VKIDDAALYAIARGADGGMRDAESTLEQLISFCGDKIEEPDVLTMFALPRKGKSLALSRRRARWRNSHHAPSTERISRKREKTWGRLLPICSATFAT